MSDQEAAIRAARKRLATGMNYGALASTRDALETIGHSRQADLETAADVRPDDGEKYTPEWAQAEFGPGRLYIRGDSDILPVCIDFDPNDDVLWITNADGQYVVVPHPPTRGAARRLVAALRECCEGGRNE